MGGWTGVGKDRINWNGQMEQRDLVPSKDNDLITKFYVENNFLKLDASNDPITEDLQLSKNMIIDGRLGIGVDPISKIDVLDDEDYRIDFKVTGNDKRVLNEVKNDTSNIFMQQIAYGNTYVGALNGINLADTAWMTGSAENVVYGSKKNSSNIIFIGGSNSTEVMRINDVGNVGIGTNNPDTTLHVQGSAGAFFKIGVGDNAIIEINKQNLGKLAIMNFRAADSTNWAFGTPDGDVVGSGDEFFIGKIITGANPMFWIENNGNIGIATSNPQEKLAVAGNLVLPKASGNGIKVDNTTPTFGFADIIGDQFSNNTGATKPILTAYNGDVKAWKFGVGDEAYMSFHIPHDHVPGTDIFLHIHWSHIGTFVTGGTITFKATSIYAKGHNQAPFQSTPAVGTFTGTASTTQYQHILSEVSYSDGTPTGLEIDTDLLEPDGVIEMTFEVDANDITVSEGLVPDPFIHFVDIHYQSTGLIGTKSRAPDFYT